MHFLNSFRNDSFVFRVLIGIFVYCKVFFLGKKIYILIRLSDYVCWDIFRNLFNVLNLVLKCCVWRESVGDSWGNCHINMKCENAFPLWDCAFIAMESCQQFFVGFLILILFQKKYCWVKIGWVVNVFSS